MPTPTAAIDLRSDTVTQPCAPMRHAMASAVVGDDVIDVDPTINRLECVTAEMLGTEAAIFMPSGTMTNQIAIRAHCQPGDEFLCEEECHIYNYEQGAFAQLSGLVARTIKGDHGILRREHVVGKIRAAGADHLVQTRLVCLENTHNRAGGRVLPLADVRDVCQWAAENGLSRHLDGARLFNAVAATDIPAHEWASHFDSVSVCFSKGLGAPVGSALAGPREFIRTARRHRKLFGGGMRQAGIIAAGALFALEHNASRLKDDHARARRIADAVQRSPGVTLGCPTVDSNIVVFDVDPEFGDATSFVAELERNSVRMLAMGSHCVRAVTHLDVNDEQVDVACKIIQQVAESITVSASVHH